MIRLRRFSAHSWLYLCLLVPGRKPLLPCTISPAARVAPIPNRPWLYRATFYTAQPDMEALSVVALCSGSIVTGLGSLHCIAFQKSLTLSEDEPITMAPFLLPDCSSPATLFTEQLS